MPTLFTSTDVRYALRLLAKTPGFTLLTLAVLTGGLAVSIFTFSFLHTAMVAPLPLDQGERIVRMSAVSESGATRALEAGTLARIRPAITTLTTLGAYATRSATLGRGREARPIEVTATEPALFAAARVPAQLGRFLTPDDAAAGAEPVIVLGHACWQVAFGGDPTVVGRTVELGGVPTRVIGIMPEGFGFPVAAQAWAPIDRALLDPIAGSAGSVDVFARLADETSVAEAEAELAVLLERVRAADPDRPGDAPLASGIRLRSFPMAQMGDEGPLVLAVLNLLAGLILLLACINVGNLLLARANERSREMAVRQALGAPRARLVMQNLWESVILCLVGGGLACLVAVGALDRVDGWAQANLEGNLAFWWRWGFDRSLLLAAAGFVVLAIAVLGGLVALRATRERFVATLREGSAGAGGVAGGRLGRLLVVIQIVAVSVVLYAGALAAVVGQRVLTIDLGYDSRQLLAARIDLPADRYPDPTRLAAIQTQVAEQIEQQPGVASVMIRSALADLGDQEAAFEVAGRPPDAADAPRAHVQAVLGPLTPLGVPVLDGRSLGRADHATGEPTVMISRAVAERYWGGDSPIGRQLRLAALEGDSAPWRTVVGVVADVPMGNPLARDRSPLAVYVPLGQVPVRSVSIVVKHQGSEAAARVAILGALAATDPLIVPASVASLDEILTKSSLMATSTARMFGGCFLFALLLSVTGTYGLMARSVGRRSREIGLRRALGATEGQVLRLLVWQGGRELGIGVLMALPLTALSGLAFSRVFPIGAGVAVATAVLVSVTVTAAVLAATWLPTRRALRIEPVEVLRGE